MVCLNDVLHTGSQATALVPWPQTTEDMQNMRHIRSGLAAVLGLALCGAAMGQNTVAEVLEKGGRPISKADFLSVLPFSITLKWPNKQGEEDVVLHPDGRISGKGYH